MKSVANTLLAVFVISVLITSFSGAIKFIPWYLTLVYETFDLSMRAANENCITQSTKEDITDNLKSHPLFKKEETSIQLSGPDSYQKRGTPFDVGIQARFPFEISMFGTPNFFYQTVTVSFNLKTTGIKYDKNLE